MSAEEATTIATKARTADGAHANHADRLMLIDGKLVESEQLFVSVNPASGTALGYAPDGTVADAAKAVAAARCAFDTTNWSTNTKLRLHCLDQLHRALQDHSEELRALTIAEVGATRALTENAQLDAPIASVRYYADLLRTYPMREEIGEIEFMGQQHYRWVEKEAVGVVAAIIAYNFPNQLALAKLAPALAAGCTVILKAAPDTPLVTLFIGELIANHTDIPPGVVNVLSSSDTAVGELLTTDPAVDMVTFTGSTTTGRKIMAAASTTVKRVFLELGGKSAMIVLDDADFATCAMMAAFTITAHAGQGCSLTTRLLVPREDHDGIVEMIKQNLGLIKHGDPAESDTYMGPLISEKQRDKVDAMVRRAVAGGATLAAGGTKIDPGFFYQPTVLTNVDPDSEVAQDEVFGPVLVVIAYDDDDDAVRIANNSIYGLSGSVMSANRERAEAVGRRIRSGTISINGGTYAGPDSPFGGYKQSGIGRENGVAGLEEFLERKTFGALVT